MIDILKSKFKPIVVKLEEEHGPIMIFALFLREDPLGQWDVVVSAPWLDPNNKSSYDTVASKIQKSLNNSELVQISRIVLLETTDPVVSFLQDKLSITNGGVEEFSGEVLSERFGFTIKKAYVLRCRKS